ncbi:MAG: ABC transporter permease [Proteobacteria bacterium]|nr:ABC transporter permease [Pseudomonadota bacterium]
MRKYAFRRILLLIPTLFLVTFIVFSSIRFIPGDVVELMVADQGYADDSEELREMLGMNKPVIVQYFIYMKNVFQGDLGISFWSGEPVIEEIGRRFPISVNLACLALVWTILFGITFGVVSALAQDTWLDYVIRVYAIGWLSIPGFWVATMIVVFGSIWFEWIPPMDYVSFIEDPVQNLSQLLAPSLILSLALSASVMRMTRAMMLEVMLEDYIRTAKAKGLTAWVVVMRHALKNAMIPVVTITGTQLAFLFGGTIIMEQIFVLPGMGKYMLEAITWRDYPVIQGIIFFAATALMLINLAVDLIYGFLDPKIRYQ